ncbi:hypothetical protein L6452_21905 [Arctium lappa]|uniref:Uncharacterized protein n=1 Tax=Arctium lappa TaxID=4217 RepID=A0ACB9AYP6_ARCLA|nr:hypothetical protein L6452_21905 [Arctium lappa]
MSCTLWQVRSYHDEMEFRHIYDIYPTLVALKIHHRGRFTKFPGREYLRDGGLPLDSDMDVLQMLKFVPQCKVFDIYTEHWMSRINSYNLSLGNNEDGDNDIDNVNDFEKGNDIGINGVDTSMLDAFDPFWEVDGNDTGIVEGNDTSQVESNAIGKVEGNDTSHVEGNAIGKVEGNAIGKVEGNDTSQVEGKSIRKVEGNETDDDTNNAEGNETDDVDGSDGDFEEEMQNVFEDVDVDMKTFRANTDCDAEWVEKNDGATETPNMVGDVDAVDMDDIDSNTDDSDLEAERKTLLKILRKEKAAVEEDILSFYVGKVFGSKEDCISFRSKFGDLKIFGGKVDLRVEERKNSQDLLNSQVHPQELAKPISLCFNPLGIICGKLVFASSSLRIVGFLWFARSRNLQAVFCDFLTFRVLCSADWEFLSALRKVIFSGLRIPYLKHEKYYQDIAGKQNLIEHYKKTENEQIDSFNRLKEWLHLHIADLKKETSSEKYSKFFAEYIQHIKELQKEINEVLKGERVKSLENQNYELMKKISEMETYNIKRN